MRVKRGTVRRAKHKKVLKLAKGYQGRKRTVFKLAKQAVEKAKKFAYRDRRNKKRVFRAVWIVKINAAVREYGLTYSTFINKLAAAKILVNRKEMSDMIDKDPKAFKELVDKTINKQ